MYHQQFFGSEGVKDTGAEFSHLFDLDFYLNLTMGITSGNEFLHTHNHTDHEHAHTGNAHVPTHYFRLSSFKELSYSSGLDYGLNYVGRTDAEKIKSQYMGADFIYKSRAARIVEHLLQGEVWHRSQDDGHDLKNDLGFYLYYEKGFDQFHSVGLRFDYYKPENDDHDHHDEEDEGHHHGLEFDDAYQALSLSYIYQNSEFLRTRVTLEQSRGFLIDEKKASNTALMVQLLFNVGAHPAHLY